MKLVYFWVNILMSKITNTTAADFNEAEYRKNKCSDDRNIELKLHLRNYSRQTNHPIDRSPNQLFHFENSKPRRKQGVKHKGLRVSKL